MRTEPSMTLQWVTDLIDDTRYAFRSLRRTAGLTAFVSITLALGVGMSTATFSMLDGLILRPYPVEQPSSIVTLASTTRDTGFDDFSYREYRDIQRTTNSYEGVIANSAIRAVGFSSAPGETPRVRGGMLTSGNYFRVQLFNAMLFNAGGVDLLAYIVIVPSLLAVTMIAAYVPARRASHLAPTQALRTE